MKVEINLIVLYVLYCIVSIERRRIIKQAMTFFKILNNIIKISPPSGLLTRSHNRHHYIVPRSRLNTVVYSFYPRAIRIWNTIPKAITEITQPESFQAAISKLPFITQIHLKMIVTKPHSGIIVLMLSRLSPVSWQFHTVVSDRTVSNLSPHSGILVLLLSRLLPVSWQCHTVVSDHTVFNLSPHTGIIVLM